MKGLRLLGRAVRYELGIWRSLAVWLLRLPTVPPGARGHRYAGAITPLMIVFIAVSAIELPILHLLLPWETVRLIGDVLSAWALLWMVGLLAALRVHPHIVSDEGIRVRYHFSVNVLVPWAAIASVRSRGRMLERSRTVQCEQSSSGLVASVAVGKQTTVDLVLREPTVLNLARAGGEPVVELRFYADDASALVADVRERVLSAS
jgi:Bacterial PH domain